MRCKLRTRARRRLALAAAGAAWSAAAAAQQPPTPGFADALLGRWDLTIDDPSGPYPSWLEVRLRTETELMGRFVGRFGSVRYLTTLSYDDGRLRVVAPVQYERRPTPLVLDGALVGDALSGTTLDAAGRVLSWTGARAPIMAIEGPPQWGPPIALFDGKDLAGWRPRGATATDCWSVAAGELAATPPCVDLLTTQTFGDFMLRAELRFPPGGNSGIYLRGRYEVQIQDDSGKALDPLRMGGVYGFLAPSSDAALPAGEWQVFEITLVGRRISVSLNGTTIIDGQEIPGITGGALDSNEGSPGPIMLQGDHTAIAFRDITLTPRRR